MENQNQEPKQNPKKKPVGPARPNPLAYAHSPAHSAILSGYPSALRRLLSSLPNPPSSVLDRRDVPHRETPLHLALRLGDLSAAAAIAAAGADASLRSSSGWSPLDEALCLHGPTLASALLRHHHRHAVLRWRRRLPRLAAALRRSSSKDFYMEVSFRFESHVIPFVGRIAPSDTYRIRKSGADVRADTSLAGFDGFRIRRSDRSFLFLGDRNPSRPSLLILDRASKRVYEAMEMEGEPSMPRSTEEEFVTQKYVCMAGVDFAEAKLVKKTNWLKQEVKERVGQYKAKLFEIHNVNFRFKTRKVVGEGFGSSSSSSSELELEEEDGFLVAENIELQVPARHSSFEGGEARVVVEKGRRRGGKVRVGLWSRCRPMMEVFRSDDLVGREGDWWVYEAEVERVEEKLRLPVGSCKLALPLWSEGTNEAFDATKLSPPLARARREAFATVLHSSDTYVCGAIALAQSIRATKSSRDLVLLLDKSIPGPKRQALAKAGWKLVDIDRIRNPRAEKYSYNEYNYSKLRLWQLLGYDKVVFIDADIVVLRNLDVLFSFPQLSATGNDGSIFNSGIMVIEPSNRTFAALMTRTVDIVSYNGGDQGFLNEVFVWWHRLPRRVNFLKNFWANTTAEASVKNRLFGADPPELYAIHYLGLKPWLCYRDYDCNWNIGDQRVYASDVAHRRWWTVHDKMEKELQGFCGLTERRMTQLDRDRKMAMQLGLGDGHWRINVSDPRRLRPKV